MKLFVVFAVALVGAVHAGYIKNDGHSGSGSTGHGSYSGSYSSIGSSGLRTIAQGSANQANSAVAQQHAAARQASYVAKNTLAQSASQSAATAQAALTGKYILLQTLEQFVQVLREIFGATNEQAGQSQNAAAAAAASVQRAQQNVAEVNNALISAQSVLEQANQAAATANAEYASQQSMVEKAKNRLLSIENQLETVRINFAATQEAAEKASLAAQAAQNNAAAAASRAAHELEKTTSYNSIDNEEYGHLIDVKSNYSH